MNQPPLYAPLGEIETPRPLQAHDGAIHLTGWYLDQQPEPPEVRLVTAGTKLLATTRISRPDLAAQYSSLAAAHLACGFTIKGHLPSGVHLARLEARQNDGKWLPFITCTVSVAPPGLQGAIEQPTGSQPLTRRVHVSGWVSYPRGEVASLDLHYGHQSIPCDLGLPRNDATVHGTARSFRSHTNLSAGHGVIRLKARLTDGTVSILRTKHTVHIDRDENHDGSIDFSAAPIPLPHAPPHPAPQPPQTAAPLNILFVLHGSFSANSALHVTSLANELGAVGHRCIVAITHDLETFQGLPNPKFHAILHAEAAAGVTFADGRAPDLIHAWTTRECVRRLCAALLQKHPAKLLVHLEDNEQAIVTAALGKTHAELLALPPVELDRLITPHLSHPRRAAELLAKADGVTLLIDRLAEFVPAATPWLQFWPAADSRYFFPRALPETFRQQWNRQPGETVLFYHGNVHAANAGEMRELYRAIVLLNRTGHPTTLIRAGLDSVDFLGTLQSEAASHTISLGLIANYHLPPLMAMADMFVQPGVPDNFNDYRIPSKLPEFFAIGRPVILPRTNLGEHAQHLVDAYVLERADTEGICQAVVTLRQDRSLCESLGQGAIAFAQKHFHWRHTAEKLAKFYTSISG